MAAVLVNPNDLTVDGVYCPNAIQGPVRITASAIRARLRFGIINLPGQPVKKLRAASQWLRSTSGFVHAPSRSAGMQGPSGNVCRHTHPHTQPTKGSHLDIRQLA